MELTDAIVKSITEISEKYNLNATDISKIDNNITWKSKCGILEQMCFRVSFEKITTSLEKGIRDISTLISFGSLIDKPENSGFATNIREASVKSRAPYQFRIIDDKRVEAYIYSHSFIGYSTIYISYDVNEDTGEYEWFLPDGVDELYVGISQTESSVSEIPEFGRTFSGLPSFTMNEYDPILSLQRQLTPPIREDEPVMRMVSAYEMIGLRSTQSGGIPITETINTIRMHSLPSSFDVVEHEETLS